MSESYSRKTNLKRKIIKTKPEKQIEQNSGRKYYPTLHTEAPKENKNENLDLPREPPNFEPGTALILLT